MIFSVLVGNRILISAASPFKNLQGWREVERYKLFLYEGIIRFPLDARHQGRIEHYINSRIKKISDSTGHLDDNPEYTGYTSAESEHILNLINLPALVTDKPIDCDGTFRSLVATDAYSESSESLHGILFSKKLGFGKEDFLAYVSETATNESELFQRFNVVDGAPEGFLIDGVLKQQLYRRLDHLFFLANARSCGMSWEEANVRFVDTLGFRLRAFSHGYIRGGISLYDLLVSMDDASIISISQSEEIEHFLQQFKSWIDNAVRHFYEYHQFGKKWARRDKQGQVVARVMTSAFAVTLSELLGWTLSSITNVPFTTVGKISAFIVGLFPQLTLSLNRTSAFDLFKLAERHPRMKAMNRTIGEDRSIRSSRT